MPKSASSILSPTKGQVNVSIDVNLRREELKDALLDYEDTHPGNNLVGSKVYEFLRHCQNIVWKQLADMAVSNPSEFAAWENGERGHWPLETNNVAHGILLRLSEGRRARLHQPGPSREEHPGAKIPAVSDNIRRTVLNWRRKTTATWVTQTGDTLNGFPFFLSWTRLNRAGEVDPKGRGNVIGLVNMTWIFGPEWVDRTGENATDAERAPEDYPEKFSTIPQYIKTVEKKKNEEERFSAIAEDNAGSAQAPIKSGMKTAQHQGTSPAPSEQFFEQKNIAPAPAAAGGALARATALWQYMLLRLYAPLFGTGRIRRSTEYNFWGLQFHPYTVDKCVELLTNNLHAARNSGDATLEEAEIRLREAIDCQVKYMEDNPDVWVLPPEKFLRLDQPNGTLLSALRLFVKEQHAPPLPPDPQKDESDREIKNRLYARLLSLGANRTHPGTFSRWYMQYGRQHLEACMIYMAQQAERRRQLGKPKGHEFESNRGGASAYFASLIARFDSKGLNMEMELDERRQLKLSLWKVIDDIESDRKPNTPDQNQLLLELSLIHSRLIEDQDFKDAALHDTNNFFQIKLREHVFFLRDLVLIHYVQNLNSEKPC